VLHCTRGIVFLGTPHYGSGLAQWAERLAKAIGLLKQTNPQILAVLESDSEVLARIQDSFYVMIRSRAQDKLPPIEITCFFEELPLPVVGIVVPSHSAILPGYIPIGIRSNHMDMTKFEDTSDPGFTAVAGELRRWVRELVAPSDARAVAAATPQQEPSRTPQSITARSSESRTTVAASTINACTWYRFTLVHRPGFSLDIINDGHAHEDGKLQIAPTGNYSGQLWQVIPSLDGRYRLRTMYTGPEMYLNVRSENNLEPHLTSEGPEIGRHWHVVPNGDGTVKLQLKIAEKEYFLGSAEKESFLGSKYIPVLSEQEEIWEMGSVAPIN